MPQPISEALPAAKAGLGYRVVACSPYSNADRNDTRFHEMHTRRTGQYSQLSELPPLLADA